MSFENDMLEKLILEGSVEVAGIDIETGAFLYNFTKNLEETNPEMFKSVMDSFYSGVMILWEKGFVDIDMNDDDPLVTLTDKADDVASRDELTPLELSILESIIVQFNKS